MKRRLLNLLTAASVVLLATVGVAWWASYQHIPDHRWTDATGLAHGIELDRGRVIFYVAGGRESIQSQKAKDPTWGKEYLHHWLLVQHGGAFTLFLDRRTGEQLFEYWKYWIVSLWAPALAAAALPAFRLAGRARRALRHRNGLCPRCGYDLRATPGRCPECGHTPTANA